MSAKARTDLAKLVQKYSKHFKVPIEEIKTREDPDDCVVFCPTQPELPVWSLGYND